MGKKKEEWWKIKLGVFARLFKPKGLGAVSIILTSLTTVILTMKTCEFLMLKASAEEKVKAVKTVNKAFFQDNITNSQLKRRA